MNKKLDDALWEQEAGGFMTETVGECSPGAEVEKQRLEVWAHRQTKQMAHRTLNLFSQLKLM